MLFTSFCHLNVYGLQALEPWRNCYQNRNQALAAIEIYIHELVVSCDAGQNESISYRYVQILTFSHTNQFTQSKQYGTVFFSFLSIRRRHSHSIFIRLWLSIKGFFPFPFYTVKQIYWEMCFGNIVRSVRYLVEYSTYFVHIVISHQPIVFAHP